jgi:hypothetical protein
MRLSFVAGPRGAGAVADTICCSAFTYWLSTPQPSANLRLLPSAAATAMSIETIAVRWLLLPFAPAVDPLEIWVITFARRLFAFRFGSVWVFRWSLFSIPKILCMTYFCVWVALLKTILRKMLQASKPLKSSNARAMTLYFLTFHVIPSTFADNSVNLWCKKSKMP